MSAVVGRTIQSQLKQVRAELDKKNSNGNIDGLFFEYVISNKSGTEIEWNVRCSEDWLKRNAENIKQGNYTNISALGFSIHNHVDGNARNLFIEGLEQLMKRDPFPTNRMSFVFFPRLFMGIVLGVKQLEGSSRESKIVWLKETFEKRRSIGIDETQRLLYLIIESLLQEKPSYVDHSIIEAFRKIEECSTVYWSAKNGYVVFHNPEKSVPLLAEKIITFFSLNDINTFNETELPFIYSSVNNIVLESVGSLLLTPNHVSKILQNFESAMKRWVYTKEKKWEIENEYDVQSILYLILRSHFEDIEYEDPTPKHGHTSSRLDFKIPSIKVIVEVKFIREQKDFGRIENEIKTDSVNYVISTGYKKLIVFIYDESSSVQDHETTIRSLKKVPSIEDVIIASKPSHIG